MLEKLKILLFDCTYKSNDIDIKMILSTMMKNLNLKCWDPEAGILNVLTV